MIKFFRKIRQNLLMENKMGKYFKYAIGEIILVVIGILIALQINNWNEDKKNNKVENKALLDLKKEFISNMEDLNVICNIRAKDDNYIRQYLNLITNDTVSVAKKAAQNIPGVYGARWGSQTTVLSGIINSGGLDNIKNDSLKTLLTYWPILVSRWEKRETLLQPSVENLRNYTASEVFRGIPKKGGTDWIDDYPNYDENKLISQRKNVVNDLKYHNLVANLIGELWVQQVLCDDLNREYKKIIAVLDNELSLRKLK